VIEDHDDDLVPASVRLGNVVPPEDPEDWTKPLTWVAAAGMLAAPAVALAVFALAPPSTASAPAATTWLVAMVLAAGAAVTGATQIGPLRVFTATLAAALFASLLTIAVGAALSGERQVGAASPALAHAVAASLAGLAGAAPAAGLGPPLAGHRSRWLRTLLPAVVAAGVAAVVLPLLFRA
jgi:hypothetical protein